MNNTNTILVTGATGFIGSHFTKYILKNTNFKVIGFNRNSDQTNLKRLENILNNPRFKLIYGDITNINNISGLLEDVDYVVNFAAKTFVDHSIKDPFPFINSNIIGTYNLLEEARKYKSTLQKYIQISTDEVYGSIIHGSYKEDSKLNPTNPYSATKAASDMLCISYYNTYNLPIIITRTENNYGEYQHPQKAIPKFVKYTLNNKKLPIYGDGKHRRTWLYAEDHCSAIMHLLTNGKHGEIYHIAGEQELENIELAEKILDILNINTNQIEFIDDFNIRPGHDRRYALNTEKLKLTGWKPSYSIDSKLKDVVNWYKNNQWWF